MTGFGGNNFGTGFERLSSAPFTPGMMDKLGGANTEFSRLASLGNFAAAQNNAFARVSSTVSNIQGDAFTRAASSFIPFPNHGFESVSSLAGSIVPQLQSDQHNGVDANGAVFFPFPVFSLFSTVSRAIAGALTSRVSQAQLFLVNPLATRTGLPFGPKLPRATRLGLRSDIVGILYFVVHCTKPSVQEVA